MEYELLNPFVVHGDFDFFINFDDTIPSNRKYAMNGIGWGSGSDSGIFK